MTMRLFGLIPVFFLFVLSACVDTTGQTSFGSSAGKKKEEIALEREARSLNQVSNDIIVKNTVEGAVLGAVAGCGIALLLGGDGADCAKGAAVGGIAGGVGGNQVGKQAAQKNKEIVKSAEILKNLSSVSQRLNSVEVKLRSVLRAQNAEVRSLKRQLDAQQISKSSYQSRVKAINSNRSAIRASLEKSEKNIVKAQGEIASARKAGQPGLSAAARAASGNKARLARTKASIKLIN